MDHEYLLESAVRAAEQLAEWRRKLVDATEPIDQLPAEDMVRVLEIVVSHVGMNADEATLRSGISDLREAMSTSLDVGAFMAAQNAIDTIHDILGDEAIDIGLVPRTLEDAVRFLTAVIAPADLERFRADIIAGRGQGFRESFRLGMSVRNSLRTAGFTEAALGIPNLDDVWYALFERAVLVQGAT